MWHACQKLLVGIWRKPQYPRLYPDLLIGHGSCYQHHKSFRKPFRDGNHLMWKTTHSSRSCQFLGLSVIGLQFYLFSQCNCCRYMLLLASKCTVCSLSTLGPLSCICFINFFTVFWKHCNHNEYKLYFDNDLTMVHHRLQTPGQSTNVNDPFVSPNRKQNKQNKTVDWETTDESGKFYTHNYIAMCHCYYNYVNAKLTNQCFCQSGERFHIRV